MEHTLTVQISHDPRLNKANSVILPEYILHQLIEQNKLSPVSSKSRHHSHHHLLYFTQDV